VYNTNLYYFILRPQYRLTDSSSPKFNRPLYSEAKKRDDPSGSPQQNIYYFQSQFKDYLTLKGFPLSQLLLTHTEICFFAFLSEAGYPLGQSRASAYQDYFCLFTFHISPFTFHLSHLTFSLHKHHFLCQTEITAFKPVKIYTACEIVCVKPVLV
jgi:hypothetical protein